MQHRTIATILTIVIILFGAGPRSSLWAVDHWDSANWLDGFSVFGMVRFRPFFTANEDFDRSTDDTSEFVGQKIQFGIEKKFTEDTRMLLRFQDSRLWGGNPGSDAGHSTANDNTSDSLDVREAYLESNNVLGPIGVKIGRQIIHYGSGRQLGRADWNNVGRSFDALEFHWSLGPWKSHLFGAVIAEEDSDSGGNNTHVGRSNASGFNFNCDATTLACTVTASTARELDDAYMAAFYNEIELHPQFQIEPYYIGIYKKWIPATTSAYPGFPVAPKERSRQRDNLHTFGIRITNKTVNGKSASDMFDYSVEGAWQTGTTGQRVQAGWDYLNQTDSAGNPIYTEKVFYGGYAANAEVGYRPLPFMRIALIYDRASGDPNRNDGTASTYYQLYPANHSPMGIMDMVGWRNMEGKAAAMDFAFGKYGSLHLKYWHFRKDKLQDSWYGSGGSAVTDSNGNPLSTETSSNARYNEVLNSNGTIKEHSAAELGQSLFHEYNIEYVLGSEGLELA
ncbi:MAG: alginate export family protein, partial [Leptospiraceae bacterium]|nr:alginate export family protein [Leptospiraceae bacterium]